MGRLQHVGWFFSRGFGPQGFGSPAHDWGYRWTSPQLYQQAARELDQAGLDLVVMEDALSLGNDDTLGLRVRSAYGGPKHDPLLLAPYLFDVTTHLGLVPTINAGVTPPYLAARQAATLHHLSDSRFGINLVTDVGSARHVGREPLPHDAAYDRAEEWVDVVRRLWHSWDEDALVDDSAGGRFADPDRIRPFRHEGEHFAVAGPLNALPFPDGDPLVVSPGGSGRGLAFAGSRSDVQLALAPLTVAGIRAHREKVLDAAALVGRKAADLRVLFVVKPELVSSAEEADRVVAASRNPTEAVLRQIAVGFSSDLETDLTVLPLDRPLPPSVFGPHVSRGSIAGLLAGADAATTPLRELLAAAARKDRLGAGTGLVGTAEEFADLVEELGEDADNDGFLLSGDLHPTTVHRFLDDLVPVLRRRGVLRREFGGGGLRGNLFDF